MKEYVSLQAVLDIALQYCTDDDGSCSKADVDLREMLDEIEALPTADVQPINQWVSVKDRLPDEPCECLGVVDGEVTEVNYSPKQMGYICVWSMCDADGFRPLPDDAVTHWMSLPEPPQD